MSISERLESKEVFSYLRPEQVNSISDAAELVEFRAGDTVYRRGKPAHHLYVILRGEVMLRVPGRDGIAVPIDIATKGALFGSCLCFDIETYSTTAHCTTDSKLMKVDAMAFRNLLDKDLQMGYVMQRRISQIYFERYLETMRKLQAVVMNLPLETE